MKNILFITWDGPQTSYMEGLFMPIFNKIEKHISISFHVVQFTWSTSSKIDSTKKEAELLGIKYTAFPISKKPIAILGSIVTLIKGVQFLKKYIENNNISIVIPRSTMPAIMVNRLSIKNIKVVFDADGLPLEERVDFSGLSKNSKQFKWLKAEETKIIKAADRIITRSNRSIDFHINTIGELYRDKFSVVFNGRNPELFNPNSRLREIKKKELKISSSDKVFVYCGSLGPQYGWNDMIIIFSDYLKINKNAHFLFLTGSPEYAIEKIPTALSDKFTVMKVPFEEVPKYLNIADVAFAIREPKLSMQGVAPIKLGEYLLMGIPTIASAGIGDTEEIIKELPDCFLYDHNHENRIKNTVTFIDKSIQASNIEIRKIGLHYFSLEKSAESYINVLKFL